MLKVSAHDEYPPKFRIEMQSLMENSNSHSMKGGSSERTPPQSAPKGSLRLLLRFISLFIAWLINITNLWTAGSQLMRLTCSSDIRTTFAAINVFCETDIALYATRAGTDVAHSPLLHSLATRVDALNVDMERVRGILGMDLDPNPDFSTSGQGAHVIPEFTSRSTVQQSRVANEKPLMHVRLPVVVLEDNVFLGDCWEFSGSQGTIGIKLAEPIVITSLSVHYIPSNRLSRTSRSRTPKSLVLWGLVQVGENVPGSFRFAQDFSNAVGSPPPSSVPKNGKFVPILHVQYTPSLEFPTQSFALPTPFLAHQATYEVVIVEVTDNWGGDVTCLYHIGIHGIS
ncbi:hypothetical protein CVT24_005861 [Panaeolus cyanescens]|uniref:SUN domain-containing protein n=1 Tax=Panaeolus cyanescens TaxID=181874 RepID=A0A409YEX7_9AGAR|nr:hypothetical protein CVT24_005861 [Panaeolus cyanescens]